MYHVKDSSSSCEYLANATVESTVVQQLLSQIIGVSASEKIIKSLVGTAIVEPGVIRKLLLNSDQSKLGLSSRQIAQLKAAIELGRQLFLPTIQTGQVIDSPEIASMLLNQHIGFESVEKFCVLVMNVKHQLIATEIISVGTATETLACPHDVFGCVLRLGGTRCIVGHNHPSESLEPSPEDIALTKQIIQAGDCIGIPVLDHLIVSHGSFKSLRQETDLWN